MRMVHPSARDCASLASPNIEMRQRSGLLVLSPALSACALAVLAFSYAAVMLAGLAVGGKERDLSLFMIGTLLLAPICAAVQVRLVRPDFDGLRANPAETVNCWSAIVLLLALASIP